MTTKLTSTYPATILTAMFCFKLILRRRTQGLAKGGSVTKRACANTQSGTIRQSVVHEEEAGLDDPDGENLHLLHHQHHLGAKDALLDVF